jgi:hypothetical protein
MEDKLQRRFVCKSMKSLGEDGRQNDFIVLGSKVQQRGAQRVHAYEIPVGH